MSRYSELAAQLSSAGHEWGSQWRIGQICVDAAAALRELEAENRLYSESLANATQEIERLREALQEVAEGEYADPRDARDMARAALEGKG